MSASDIVTADSTSDRYETPLYGQVPGDYHGPVADDVKMPPSWLLLVYRVPSEPSRHRVAVWREMKRMGGLYVQKCVCLLPAFKGVRPRVRDVAARIDGMEGSSLTFEVRRIPEPQLSEIVAAFRAQSEREYDEIIEECTTKFQKEIDFERFRQNFTYEEAEEIYSDLEKIRSWLALVVQRDWFGASNRDEAERQVALGTDAYEQFERECFAASGDGEVEVEAVPAPSSPAAEPTFTRSIASGGRRSGRRARPRRPAASLPRPAPG